MICAQTHPELPHIHHNPASADGNSPISTQNDFSSTSDYVKVIQVEDNFAQDIRFDLHYGPEHTVAALFSVRLAAWISDISSATLWLYIISNLLGNILILLSLTGYIPSKWLWLFVFVSLPLVVVALLNSNVYISKLLATGFEFWFLVVLMCLYIVTMADA